MDDIIADLSESGILPRSIYSDSSDSVFIGWFSSSCTFWFKFSEFKLLESGLLTPCVSPTFKITKLSEVFSDFGSEHSAGDIWPDGRTDYRRKGILWSGKLQSYVADSHVHCGVWGSAETRDAGRRGIPDSIGGNVEVSESCTDAETLHLYAYNYNWGTALKSRH